MRLLFACLALLVSATAEAAPEPVARAKVERHGDKWTAEYELGAPAPVWVFPMSILPRVRKESWRLRTVRVLTPGVTLKRLGNYDALQATSGNVPRRVKLSFTPFVEDIEAGYDAALRLTDGSVALYADAFKVVPMDSAAAAARAPADDSALPGIEAATRVTFVDRAGPVLVRGKREARATLDDGNAYVLFGRARPIIGPAMTTILDPGLPKWISEHLETNLPKVLSVYRQQLGPSPVGQPTLLVSWAGPTAEQVSLGGSVLPGMVVMTLEGDGIVKRNEAVGHHARWFVAHEAAHFWLGQAVGYSERSESWITEGGADLLAFRATATADPSFDVKARLSQARRECEPFLANGGVATAYERENDFRAYYACGAIIALAAERASGGDFGNFVRTLIEDHGGDGKVTRAEWLSLLEERKPGLSAAVATLLDQKQANPAGALDEFIRTASIGDQFAAPKAAG